MLCDSSASSVVAASFSPPNHRHLWNLVLSLPVLLVLRIAARSTPYARQGFFCNDNEIRFPYVPDTVPVDLLDHVFLLVTVAAVLCSECSLVRRLTRSGSGKRLHLPSLTAATDANGRRWPPLISFLLHPLPLNCLYFMGAMLTSTWATSIICDLGKRTCSRLRPNFLAVCQPRNLSQLCPPDEFGYVQEYECTNKLFDQNEFFSFPSGHAAQVTNFAVFLIYYLQKRCKLPAPVRSFAQFFIALFAYFVCLSRVRDHKHRLADVAGGATVGMAVAIFFLNYVLHNFRPNRYPIVEKTDRIVDWAESSAGGGGLSMPISEKFTVPRRIVVVGDNDELSPPVKNADSSQKQRQQQQKLLLSLPRASVSDYGSFNNDSSVENMLEEIVRTEDGAQRADRSPATDGQQQRR